MIQASANIINSGTSSRLDIDSFHVTEMSNVLKDPVTSVQLDVSAFRIDPSTIRSFAIENTERIYGQLYLVQDFLNVSSINVLRLLGIAQRNVFIASFQEVEEAIEEAFIRTHYDIVPERTHEDFQSGYKVRMDRVKDRLHEYVDIDLPAVEDGDDW